MKSWNDISPILTMTQQAINDATRFHAGQVRKGTDTPYIVHPMYVSSVLTDIMGLESCLPIAGLLHDVLEDTNCTEEYIFENYDEEILSLVKSNTENKGDSWEKRKMHTILSIPYKSREELILLFADKFCNLHSLYMDYLEVGNSLWGRFNRGKEPQAWYYIAIYKAISKYCHEKGSSDGFYVFNMIGEKYLNKYRFYLQELFGYDWESYYIEISGLSEVR